MYLWQLPAWAGIPGPTISYLGASLLVYFTPLFPWLFPLELGLINKEPTSWGKKLSGVIYIRNLNQCLCLVLSTYQNY